ncbi:two-component system sensor histidine kinase MtrB [Actinomycetospora succinea]|uniref:Sensor histidine kinase MtrB n=2 Tax=Actinomycetospora succinea TaxID=663603 RepID=A0A4R6VR29_9PSEU|nr:MtrAB system histidine kinase MtrB [Actinomycetospora succinea]TDQ65007.1 two-component system sensor histidine kinase MtrB [Actinomycetospora succinea]
MLTSVRRRLDRFAAERVGQVRVLWRRSMQLRVVLSTLAMSIVVVAVLGLVLQTQIADRLVQGKEQAALIQADISRQALERDLARIDPDRDGAQAVLDDVLDRLSTSGRDAGSNGVTRGSDPTSDAGAFDAVLIAGSDTLGSVPGALPTVPGGSTGEISAGPAQVIPPQLRAPVLQGFLATKYLTVASAGQAAPVPTLVVGQPVRTAGRNLQLYLLFPLSAEQRTLALVQSTLALAAGVLLVLLAGISSVVTRQVVRPVRQAADVAERFADGHLDERMPVHGDDEVARLAESYNEMAASIQSQIRQLEEFGALQRRFTSDVSHELRTPLTTVRMAAEVLHAQVDPSEVTAARSAQLLVDELDRFETLLSDLLEISRLDAGMAELGLELVDVASVVRRAAETVRHLVDDTATPLLLDLGDADEPVLAEVDPRRVERILRNLLANAIDHGESRPIEVRLAADEGALAVVVRDHGIGLKPGEAGLVFNRFWRADPSRQRRSGGTGLGLAISLEDARLHGGWLQAWGEVDRGAVFRLTLPLRHGERLRTSPLPLLPVAASPAAADPGIHDAAPTTGTALPPMDADDGGDDDLDLDDDGFPEPFPQPSPPSDPGTSVAR